MLAIASPLHQHHPTPGFLLLTMTAPHRTHTHTSVHSVPIFAQPTPNPIGLPCAVRLDVAFHPASAKYAIWTNPFCERASMCRYAMCVCMCECECMCAENAMLDQRAGSLSLFLARTLWPDEGSFITYWLHLIYIQHSISLYTDISLHAAGAASSLARSLAVRSPH